MPNPMSTCLKDNLLVNPLFYRLTMLPRKMSVYTHLQWIRSARVSKHSQDFDIVNHLNRDIYIAYLAGKATLTHFIAYRFIK